MTDKQKKTETAKRLDDKQRFRYIGFEVFPGKPKDLFKSEAEKTKFVDVILKKRSKGELLRDHCTLLEERVSMAERIVLTVVSVLILASLFMPWYSAYTVVEDPVEQKPVQTAGALPGDSLAVPDSLSSLAMTGDSGAAEVTPPVDAAAAATADSTLPTEPAAVDPTGIGASTDEIIHGLKARKRTHKEYTRLSGIGGLLALGSVGSYVFSSGAVLVLSAILFILYTVLCVALPAYTLYTLYGAKGNEDARALTLKKQLKLNWLPIILFLVVLTMAFVGAGYGFDVTGMYDSIGASYGVGPLLDSLSWGYFLTIGGFLLMAAKGMEI